MRAPCARSGICPACGATTGKLCIMRHLSALLLAGFCLCMLNGCQMYELMDDPKELRPLSASLKRKMAALDMRPSDPVMMRIFKEEGVLEVWKQSADGPYRLLKSYEICNWSGTLGPKHYEGDRQSPEGFYSVGPANMNPDSRYHLAFNIGFPNRFDRAHGRTGSHLMVHGACASVGCYAMTDAAMEEIYALGREAFRGGQRRFQVQAFPFHMTAANMARHRHHEAFGFWQNLKTGYDHFEATHRPPEVNICARRYVFDAVADHGSAFNADAPCPPFHTAPHIAAAVNARIAREERRFAHATHEMEQPGIAQVAALAFGDLWKDLFSVAHPAIEGTARTAESAARPDLSAAPQFSAPPFPASLPRAGLPRARLSPAAPSLTPQAPTL